MQTEEEWTRRGGLIVPDNLVRNFNHALSGKGFRLPKALDYRKKGMVTPVKNQVRGKRIYITNYICNYKYFDICLILEGFSTKWQKNNI